MHLIKEFLSRKSSLHRHIGIEPAFHFFKKTLRYMKSSNSNTKQCIDKLLVFGRSRFKDRTLQKYQLNSKLAKLNFLIELSYPSLTSEYDTTRKSLALDISPIISSDVNKVLFSFLGSQRSE